MGRIMPVDDCKNQLNTLVFLFSTYYKLRFYSRRNDFRFIPADFLEVIATSAGAPPHRYKGTEIRSLDRSWIVLIYT